MYYAAKISDSIHVTHFGRYRATYGNNDVVSTETAHFCVFCPVFCEFSQSRSSPLNEKTMTTQRGQALWT